VNVQSIQQEIRAAIDRDPSRAMDESVRLLKARVPHYTWVGIYLLEGDELVLGPFLGKPSPHTRIPLGRGIWRGRSQAAGGRRGVVGTCAVCPVAPERPNSRTPELPTLIWLTRLR
jgi:putative methionine-R-sulfoxide reductase with GAF domain